MRRSAQSIVELSVFGAVLFFLIGGMASNYLSGSFQQNTQYKAMRTAMLLSAQSSAKDSGARNTGSFLLYEDRLTGEFAKFGTLDRTPLIASGTGMMTNQLYKPTGWNDVEDNAIFDMRINGQSFSFTTNAFVCMGIRLDNWSKIADFPSLSSNTIPPITDNPADPDVLVIALKPKLEGAPDFTAAIMYNLSIDCINNGKAAYTVPGTNPPEIRPVICNATTPSQRKRLTLDWRYWGYFLGEPTVNGGQTVPWTPFFKAVMANEEDFNTYPDSTVMGQEFAFNLNRNEKVDDDIPPDVYGEWKNVAWQWQFNTFQEVAGEIVPDENKYPTYDVNGDMQEEIIYGLTRVSNAPFIYASVLSPNFGDVDFTGTAREGTRVEDKGGLSPNMRIYGRTYCVPSSEDNCSAAEYDTYLDIKEGKLASSDGKAVNISKIKKNQYDIVERVFYMNPHMIDPEGFIERNRSDMGRGGLEAWCSTPANCCNLGDNLRKTCFYYPEYTSLGQVKERTLFIRSRLSDKNARRWTTGIDQDWNQSLGAP